MSDTMNDDLQNYETSGLPGEDIKMETPDPGPFRRAPINTGQLQGSKLCRPLYWSSFCDQCHGDRQLQDALACGPAYCPGRIRIVRVFLVPAIPV